MIKREIARFIIVGSLTVLIDFLSYRGLILYDLMNINFAKASGFMIGTTFAYFANRFWTFGHKSHHHGSAWRFIVLYVGTLGINVFINSIALHLLAEVIAAMQIAFLAATGISATLNFLGMKFFVFKPNSIVALQ